MQFDSWQALWEMTGHGPFVWSAYAIAFVTLTWTLAAPLLQRRRTFNELRAAERRRAARGESPATVNGNS